MMILFFLDVLKIKNLQKLISTKLDFYVNEFSKKFKIKLNLIDSFKSNSENLCTKNFKHFLLDLNVFFSFVYL